MSKIFNLFTKGVKLLDGSNLGRLPFTYLVHELIYTKLAPKGGRVLVNTSSHKMYVNSSDRGEVTTALLEKAEYFPFLTSTIKSLVSEENTCIDIGAHIGYYTLTMASKVGRQGRVYAFEPLPLNYETLLDNIAVNRYTNIIPSCKAVSNKVQRGKLLLNRVDFEGNSLLTKRSLGTLGFRTLDVDTITLDSTFKGISIDLVKVDVEGAELLVLEGMQSLVQGNKDIVLIFELLPAALTKQGSSPEGFLQALATLGLDIFDIDERRQQLVPATVDYLLTAYKGASCTNLLVTRRIIKKEEAWKIIK